MMVQIKSPKHCIKFISKHPRLIWFVIGHLIWGTASLSVGGLKTSALRFKPQEQLQMMQDSSQDVLFMLVTSNSMTLLRVGFSQ